MFCLIACLCYLSVCCASSEESHNDASVSSSNSTGNGERYHILSVDWHHVEGPFVVVLWILLASLAKIGFHLSKKFAEIFPDSSMLIVLGLVIGVVLHLLRTDERKFSLDSSVFFLFLLPPIVFDAGYFMPNRAFFDNIGTILTYAVFGTLWNAAAIGLSLWALGRAGLFARPTPLVDTLIFASLISAVDPVAVLVVFEEINVNELLFITVFGESLLNDAVTVVLYHIFVSFASIGASNIIAVDIVNGCISFFVVGLGGIAIGLLWSIAVSFTTRWTNHVKVLNPLFVFLMPFCSYLMAELFHLSGILAIVFCGIAMKPFIKANISQKAQASIKYFSKMLCSSSETIIFIFLGLSTVSTHHMFDWLFVLSTVVFCLLYRAIGVAALTALLNRRRLHRFNGVEQFIMAYGGLRGAIAYGLVVALPSSIAAKDMFVTCCIVVIYFTVFLQGMTIKPLVNFLKIERGDKRHKLMFEQMFSQVSDSTLAGIEDICGHRGHNWLRDKYAFYNKKYLQPHLMRKKPTTSGERIVRKFSQMVMREAIQAASSGRPNAPPEPQSLSRLVRSQSVTNTPKASTASRQEHIQPISLHHSQSNPVFDARSIDAELSPKNEEYARVRHMDMDAVLGREARYRYFSRHGSDIEGSPSFCERQRRNSAMLRQDVMRYFRERSRSDMSHMAALKPLAEDVIQRLRGMSLDSTVGMGASVQSSREESEFPWKRGDDDAQAVKFEVGANELRRAAAAAGRASETAKTSRHLTDVPHVVVTVAESPPQPFTLHM